MSRRPLPLSSSALVMILALSGQPLVGQEASIYDLATTDTGSTGADVGLDAAAPPAPPAQDAAHQPGDQQPLPPAPPFQLSDVEKQFVMQTLQMWETESAKVETFNADFERWEYDAVFGPGLEIPLIKSTGKVSYSKPDKGSFRIEKISRWTKSEADDSAAGAAGGDWVPQPNEIGEHWVCDGKAIYQYNHREKQLVVNPIPEHMRGQAITNGPLPFLFGAKANALIQRYWIRTKQSNPQSIWLEAYPRWQSDAANYQKVDVMLDRKTMQPKAIQVHLPGGKQRHAYMFTDVRVNEKNLGEWFTGLFSSPRTPLGWTRRVVEPLPQAARPEDAVQR